ncbi:MAG: class I SAM-dependent methyltransferase [Cryomorphaceae bacterium]|nr:class I SAM-dependent methyltransferase [Cryomorphaceae bacterium]
MKSREEVKQFYDKYTTDQIKNEKNLRHYTIVSFLKNLGLKKTHNVLEIGCGIGALSELIFKQIPKGFFVGADISPKSIDIAQKRFNKHKNVEFIISDMTSFSHTKKFDFIVLPDVLEHIPEDQHQNIIETIGRISTKETVVFINIPSPEHNAYLEIHEPEKLQVIDLQLSMGRLISHFEDNDFQLDLYEKYSIFRSKNDYIRLVFSRKKEVNFKKMRPLWKRIPEKLIKRIGL